MRHKKIDKCKPPHGKVIVWIFILEPPLGAVAGEEPSQEKSAPQRSITACKKW